ncbi:MAG: fumarylacetoacetate hydrolase family protein [Lautropia sp.]
MDLAANDERSRLIDSAAQELFRQHQERQRFSALPAPWHLDDAGTAYAIQERFVQRLEGFRLTRTCGFKIALTTPAMRQMVGYHDSISGHLLEDQVIPSGSRVRAGDYGHLLVEFEIAFRMGADLPVGVAPWTRQSIFPHVASASPALELADDRNADYTAIAGSILTLAADNAWNQGLVLGEPVSDFTPESLQAAAGIASIDGAEVGRGTGADVLGHPLDALAWLANHLQDRGQRLLAGHLVTTGSLVTSKFPQAGSTVDFHVDGLGSVTLRVD